MAEQTNDVAALVKQVVMSANDLRLPERKVGGTLFPDSPPPALASDVARIRELLEKWDREGLPAARVEG